MWNIFLWMLHRTTHHTPVVADTPFNHDWNRRMFAAVATEIEVPMVEVALHGDPDVLLRRARLRAASGRVHEIKAKFSANGRRVLRLAVSARPRRRPGHPSRHHGPGCGEHPRGR